ncbi:uncharacterized protein N7487_009540 [Penicillium crustosum]|uniref:uncharacterized protein n=1 Tax=Penicillium crustosum TaxID=36656 RepID=UPI00238BF22D|nr:uncharacterized protein N7487_009540 [Penicillium crustosum]KAJ5395237.1 hypothetical protein N7487_009540 [Penicillium crustosum]
MKWQAFSLRISYRPYYYQKPLVRKKNLRDISILRENARNFPTLAGLARDVFSIRLRQNPRMGKRSRPATRTRKPDG